MLHKKTRQIMFFQLGFYDDKIDGIFGKKSKNATKLFQQEYGLKVDSIYGEKTEKKLKQVYKKFMSEEVSPSDYEIVKYFKENEIACNDLCGYNRISKQLLYNMYALRHYMNKPMNITSGCRCLKHNKKVGSKKTSRHYNKELYTKAIDFVTKDTSKLSYRKKIIDFWIKYMPNARYAYCNKYSNLNGKKGTTVVKSMGNAIHIDVK